MNQDQIKQNLLSGHTWLRIVFMAGFAVAVWITMMVLVVIVLAQLAIVLVTSNPNSNLQRFGLLTGAYLFEIIQFLLYNTQDKPFPFAPFPDPDTSAADSSSDSNDDDDDEWLKSATGEAPADSADSGKKHDQDIPTLESHDSDDLNQDTIR